MKGLFVKDIELMKQQKQFFVLVVVMGVILNLAGSGSVSFAIGYFTIVTAIFAITTISYDEFDNGLAFLMTLPWAAAVMAMSSMNREAADLIKMRLSDAHFNIETEAKRLKDLYYHTR